MITFAYDFAYDYFHLACFYKLELTNYCYIDVVFGGFWLILEYLGGM